MLLGRLLVLYGKSVTGENVFKFYHYEWEVINFSHIKYDMTIMFASIVLYWVYVTTRCGALTSPRQLTG